MSVAKDFTSYRASGRTVMSPFIQFEYSARVFTSVKGSACALKVASGVQYLLHTSHPLPVSQAVKKDSATSVIDVAFGVMNVSPSEYQRRLCREDTTVLESV